MPKRHTSLLSLYKTQKARFDALDRNALHGMQVLKRDALEQIDDLVKGSPPSGIARKKALAALGQIGASPYARLGSRFDTSKNRFGAKALGIPSQHGVWFNLPIGVIYGALRSSKFASVDGFRLTVGFDHRAGRSIYVVLPSGTINMVGRGLWGPNEGGEMGKRMKAFRKAFQDSFFKPLTKP